MRSPRSPWPATARMPRAAGCDEYDTRPPDRPSPPDYLYGSISPALMAYLTMLAVSWTPNFSRMRLRCESAVL